jgi:hypothetical protein
MSVQGRVELGGRSANRLAVVLRAQGESAVVGETGVEPSGEFRFEPVLAGMYDVVLTENEVELDHASARPGSEVGLVLKPR